ncbi:MAG TPA: hypothetical protein VGE07_10090 [Herpetosiphonaceae bacterium]
MSPISEQPMLAVRTFIAAGTGPTLFEQCTTAIQAVNHQLDGWLYTHHLTPAQLLHVTANTHFVFQGAQPIATHSLTVIYQPSGAGAGPPTPDAPALESSEP